MTYWCESKDKWLTAVELVAELNDVTKAYEMLLGKYKAIDNHCEELSSDYIVLNKQLNDTRLVNEQLKRKLIKSQKEYDMLIKNMKAVIDGGKI